MQWTEIASVHFLLCSQLGIDEEYDDDSTSPLHSIDSLSEHYRYGSTPPNNPRASKREKEKDRTQRREGGFVPKVGMGRTLVKDDRGEFYEILHTENESSLILLHSRFRIKFYDLFFIIFFFFLLFDAWSADQCGF